MANILASAREFLGMQATPKQPIAPFSKIERGGSFANAAALAACMAAIAACGGDVDVAGTPSGTDTTVDPQPTVTAPIGTINPRFYPTEAGSHVEATGEISEELTLNFQDIQGKILTVLTQEGGTTEFIVEPGPIDVGGPSNETELECVITTATDADGNPVTISPFAGTGKIPGKTIKGSPVQLRNLGTEDPACLDAFEAANTMP